MAKPAKTKAVATTVVAPPEEKKYVLPSSVQMMAIGKQLEVLVGKVQDEVHAASEKDVIEYARAFVVLKLLIGSFEVVLKPLGDTFEEMKTFKLPEKMDSAGIDPPSINIDGAYRVTVSHTLRASIREGMKDEAIKWLKEHKLGDIVTATVNASTLSATARTMAEENKELEPAFFNVANMPNTSVTKLPKKGK